MSEVDIIVSPPVIANVVVAETPTNINAESASPINVVTPGTPPVGLPRGGTTGQVPAKASDADFDIVWIDAGTGGGGISDAPNNANSYMRSGLAWVIAATVARTGAFADLSGKPTTATGYGIPAATSSQDGYATAAQITKLDGIDDGATANDTDANLKNRANHTGTQASSTISDFDTAVDARIENIVGAAPAALDTLQEIAEALGDDADFAGTMTAALAGKEPTIAPGTTSQYYRGDKEMADLNADAVSDGTTNKAYTATEKTKLAGIATGATANDTDANLKNRANHTGTQTASTISDFDDQVAATALLQTVDITSIEVVTAYPDPEVEGVLYIKVSA
jgi:hypothetical protein